MAPAPRPAALVLGIGLLLSAPSSIALRTNRAAHQDASFMRRMTDALKVKGNSSAPPPWAMAVLQADKVIGLKFDPNDLPPPPPAASPLDALKAALQAKAAAAGMPIQGAAPPGLEALVGPQVAAAMAAAGAPGAAMGPAGAPGAPGVSGVYNPSFLPAAVASVLEPMAIPLAAAHTGLVLGAPGPTPPPAPPPCQNTVIVQPCPLAPDVPLAPITTTTTTPRLGPPLPPQCAPEPPELKNEHVETALAPNRPENSKSSPVQLKDGGLAWPLNDGGWAFQYPTTALRMDSEGNLRAAWKGEAGAPAYAVQYNEYGYEYHIGSTVVSHEANGDLVYHQPSGTVRQEGDLITYHWCDPNIIVYQTPSGVVFYDNNGMTYKGESGIAQYQGDGNVLYQGIGGVTQQKPDGSVIHWTKEGVVYHRPDGSMGYTFTGSNKTELLMPVELPPEPYPGPPLTADQVIAMARTVTTTPDPLDGVHDMMHEANKAIAGSHALNPPTAPAPAPAPGPFSEPLSGAPVGVVPVGLLPGPAGPAAGPVR